jgi:hypothetical protein
MAILIKRKELEDRIRAIAAREGLSLVEVVERAIPVTPPEPPRAKAPFDVRALWRSVGVEPPEAETSEEDAAARKAYLEWALYHDPMIDPDAYPKPK